MRNSHRSRPRSFCRSRWLSRAWTVAWLVQELVFVPADASHLHPTSRGSTRRSPPLTRSIANDALMLELRGGDSPKKKKKPKKKVPIDDEDCPTTKSAAAKRAKPKRPTASLSSPPSAPLTDDKAEINRALHESDAAEALGDAIRARADLLRRENLTTAESAAADPSLFPDPSLTSLSHSLGASDYDAVLVASRSNRRSRRDSGSLLTAAATDDDAEDSGGVEASPSAVIASYFLKSHGGAHALQSLCSLLAATAGMGAISLAGRMPEMSLVLLKRACVFALVKHVSGLAAASCLTARAIPEVGFGPARRWMQQLALEPVSQYCFYSALILLWLPRSATGATPDLWWTSHAVITLLLAGPIVLREVVSTAFVVGDVLVLLSSCNAVSSSTEQGTTAALRMLSLASAAVNAGFSVLVTPRVWRNATPAQRQAVLAKLVQKSSLAFEVAVGALLALDALRALGGFLFAPASHRPSAPSVLKRGACARWYLKFLRTRRRKIQRLAEQVRGGALHIPQYVLEVLLDPPAAMGLELSPERHPARTADDARSGGLRWRDYLRLAFESDE